MFKLIPQEINLYIFSFFDLKQLLILRITCKQFQNLLDNHRLIQSIDFYTIEFQNKINKIDNYEKEFIKFLKKFPFIKKIKLHQECNNSFLQYLSTDIISLDLSSVEKGSSRRSLFSLETIVSRCN